MVRDVNPGKPVQEENRLYVRSAPDLIYLVLIVALIATGTVMLWSAGSAYNEDEPFYYLIQHLKHLGIALPVAVLCTFFISPKWTKLGGIVIYFVSFILLCVVLVLGISRGGAQRWIQVGSITFQPSELAKTALILVLAMYFSTEPERFRFKKKNIWKSILYGVVIPGLIILSLCVPVALEKHLSGTIIIVALGGVMMFLGGTSIIWVTAFGGGGLVILNSLAWRIPYTRKRIEGLINRGADADNDWQTTEGLYAMGTGGFFGTGLGNSRLKYGYVSQPQNDFIFAVISEELGFFGSTLIMLLFLATAARGFMLAQHSSDRFIALVISGLSFKLILHVILNIGVVAAVLPNTGISLPFFSSGGTATLVQVFDAGIILGLSRFCND